jgi:hypothetical protein
MTQRKWWPGAGWVKSLEVTRGADGSAHPHFHVLIFVKTTYFNQGYIRQTEWRHHWGACMRLSYLPVVNVKTVKPKDADRTSADALKVAIMETLKYGVKPDDLVADGPWLYELTQQLHKTRAVSVGGELRDYLREKEVEDLVNDENPEAENAASPDDPRLIFDWHSQIKRYAQKIAEPDD